MHIAFQKLPEIYAAVYHAVDEAIASHSCPPRSEALVQRALAQLRFEDPQARQELASISVGLHRMRVAALTGDAADCTKAGEDLGALAQQWMRRLPIH